jgi:hypothetical protein
MAEKHPHSIFSFGRDWIKKGWGKSREKFGVAVDVTLGISAFGILFSLGIQT